jgi:molecular chaperone GrpE
MNNEIDPNPNDALPAETGSEAGATAEPASELAQVQAALVAAEAKASENWNQYLRAMADMENYRKRVEREVDNARKYAIERFAQEILGVNDALEAGLAAGTTNAGAALLAGAEATLKQLQSALQKVGVAPIDAAGKPFDPAWHEAMVAQESAEHPANTVIAVVQKGFTINGRLLRPARVVVSKAAAPLSDAPGRDSPRGN